jgi:Rrf2 family iron-sulfur cluster assembly transcriptional regulator
MSGQFHIETGRLFIYTPIVILTNKAKYATVAVIDMLESGHDKPVPLSLIAGRQNISLSFLEQIFAALKKAGIVKSIRGANGGYVLAKKLSAINLADVVAAVDEPIKMTRCGSKDGCVNKKSQCKTHHIWQGLEQNIHNYLKSISLNNL